MVVKPTLTVTKDLTVDVNAIIKKFKRDAVLVGIPEQESDRKEDTEINNAALLAINNFGSPANNIPARPVLEIGLRNAQKEIIEQFRSATSRALSEGVEILPQVYNRIGIIASNSVKKAINAQEGFPEPSEATLASRKAKGFKGTKALIVTGQMRNAITYVVKGEE